MLVLPTTVSSETADLLAERLRLSLGADVKITRPTKCADLRISGLDDSITPGDVIAAVSQKGNCPADVVKVGERKRGPGGASTIWVQCPVAAAKTLAEAGRLLVGWSSAQVCVLEPRPMKCFRCLELGHTLSRCVAETNRSDLCYRCGQHGHKSVSCSTAAVCAAAGRPTKHHVGSIMCIPP